MSLGFKEGIPLLETFADDEGGETDLDDGDGGAGAGVGFEEPQVCACGGKRRLAIAAIVAGGVGLFAVFLLCVVIPLAVVLSRGSVHDGGLGNSTVVYPSPTPYPSPSPSPSPTPLPPFNSSQCGCQSANDRRAYSVLHLENSLRVLVISDPDSNISAASMDVAVGSFSDPSDLQGLAHFCEHMLFLGTKKYPVEGEYAEYLVTHQGYDNAFTSTQETNYYFSVQADYFEGALDRFAQFFVSPLLTASAVGREMHAVDAEYQKDLLDDNWRFWRLLKTVSNPDHPFHQFSIGNLETLNKSDTHDRLIEFYQTHYSANQMQLAVYGRDSIDTLSEWVSRYFSYIPNRNAKEPTFNTTSFPPEYSGKLVYITPIADKDTILLFWQTCPLQYEYRSGLPGFVMRFLGDEGPGSVSYFLQTGRGWATSVTASTEVQTDSYSILSVAIELTAEGLRHSSDVVSAVFQYVRLMASETDEETFQQLWSDYISVSSTNFDYSEKADPSDYVTDIAESMRLVSDSSDFLQNPSRYDFDYSMFKQVLFELTPERSIVFLSSQNANGSSSGGSNNSNSSLPWQQPSKKEEFFGVQYLDVPIPDAVLNHWNRDLSNDSFQLPGANPFVPKNFDILPPPPGGYADVPVRQDFQGGASVWWLQDGTFQDPRINFYCDIHTNNAQESPRWSAMTMLYVSVATKVLQPLTYQASLVQGTHGVSFTQLGVSLSLSSFSEDGILSGYLQLILQVLRNSMQIPVEEVIFDLVKEDVASELSNYKYTELPFRYTYRYVQQVVMERPYWKKDQLLEELRNVSVDDLLVHGVSLLQNSSVLCFAHGNLNQSMAVRFAGMVAELTSAPNAACAHPNGSYPTQRVALAPGNYSVVLPTLNPEDENSVVNVVFQTDSVCEVEGGKCSLESLKTLVHLGILTQIIKERCFDYLRTKEQLGYAVFCFYMLHESIGSFQVIVQSFSYDPPYVLDKILFFLRDFESSVLIPLLNGSFAKSFSSFADVYRQGLLEKEVKLSDLSSVLWQRVRSGLNQFDLNRQAVEVLDLHVDAATLLGFYRKTVTDDTSTTGRELVIVVHGKGKSHDLSPFNIQHELDYNDLNQTKHSYP